MTATVSNAANTISMCTRSSPRAAHGPDAEAAEPVTPIPISDAGTGVVAELTLSATHPVRFFAIPLAEDALVCVTLKELSSASRCALLLSPTDPRPAREMAAWQLASPEPTKTVVVHPADSSARLGTLYVAVRFLEENGSAFAGLHVRVNRSFYAIWYRRVARRDSGVMLGGGEQSAADGGFACSRDRGEMSDDDGVGAVLPHATPIGAAASLQLAMHSTLSNHNGGLDVSTSIASRTFSANANATAGFATIVCSSLYIGAWRGRHHHGRGVCFYASTPDARAPALLLLQTMYERRSLPWSAMSLPENPTLDGTALDAAFIAKITGLLDTRTAELGPRPCADATTASGGTGIGQVTLPATPAPELASPPTSTGGGGSTASTSTESWQVVRAPIYNDGIEAYDGDWVNGRKEGHGVYQWTDRVYVGEWKEGRRHGYGELRARDGSLYRGAWRDDRRDGHGVALSMPDGCVYTGAWSSGVRTGEGSLRYPNGVIVHGTWAADALAPRCDVRAVYTDGTVYVGAWRDGRRHGDGRSTDAAGRVHIHTWVADRRHGPGTVQMPSGVRFDGEWHEDALVDGVYRFPNGDTYRGGWDEALGLREGYGTCTTAAGDVWEGEWHNDQRHGHGTAWYAASGARYTGQWVNDEPSGEGRLEDADGVYVGAFVRGERSGYGEQTGPDGTSVYRGSWQRNHRAGRGTQYDAAGDVTYTGVFLYDRLHGEGSATSAAGAYDGTWLDGLQQGHGTLRLPSGDIVRGVWHRGRQLDGRVELEGRDGGRYVGEWRDGMRCGVGAQVYARDGSVYEGEWRDDKPHGRGRLTRTSGESVECAWRDGGMVEGAGTVTFADGSVYAGDVCQSKPHGTGTLTYPDGTVFRGTFVEGRYTL